MKRSIATHVEALQPTAVDPAPIPLNEKETEYYRQAMSSLPAATRRSHVTRGLAAAYAQALLEAEEASAIIAQEGMTVRTPQGIKAHPCVLIRDRAHKRAAAIASRMKILPQGDAREVVRAAQFESAVRGSAVLPIAPAAPATASSSEPDWKRLAKEPRQ